MQLVAHTRPVLEIDNVYEWGIDEFFETQSKKVAFLIFYQISDINKNNRYQIILM